MELSAQDIERIVSEVVRRLRQAGVDVQSQDDGPSDSTAEAASGTTCTLSEHVISMDSIQGRLENVQQLVVGARAVVCGDVEPGLIVAGNPARLIKRRPLPDDGPAAH